MEPHEQPVLGIGELLWDCFPDARRPGGAPANVAFHAGKLGHPASIVSRVGDDADGRELTAYLEERGVSTDLLQVDPRRPTGRVTVDTGDPESPQFTIREGVAWDAIEWSEELAQRIGSAAAICVGTLAQRDEISRGTIRRCLESGANALVVYDVNLRQHWYRREWIERTLAFSRVVKLNVAEVTVLANILEVGPSDPRSFAEALLSRGPDLICVTRAEEGCLLVTASEIQDLPGIRVEVADAVGAGDAFTAALISARLRGWPLRRAGRFANEVGARVAARSGAMPDLQDELAALLQRAGTGEWD